jgi:uncharacterized protein YndB with AHSA1/START domain
MGERVPSPEVRLCRRIAGTACQVFEAWTVPALMRQWLFTSANSEIVDVSVDLRVGGSFSILERPYDSSGDVDHFGEYLEVIPSRRLAFTFQTPAHFPQQTRIEVAIAPVGSGSSLDFRQTGVDPHLVRHHWVRMFGDLDQLLQRGRTHSGNKLR